MATKSKNQMLSAARKIVTNRRAVVGIAAAIILIVALAVAFTGSSAQDAGSEHGSRHQSDNQHSRHEQQKSMPSTASSSTSPEGVDPASREQATLAYAASRSTGRGQRGDNPAAGVTGSQRRVDPDDVLRNPSGSGMLSSGCAVGYGKPGEQCLPVHAADSCKDVRRQFPGGIEVTGSDQLNLDRNDDKVACGAGD